MTLAKKLRSLRIIGFLAKQLELSKVIILLIRFLRLRHQSRSSLNTLLQKLEKLNFKKVEKDSPLKH